MVLITQQLNLQWNNFTKLVGIERWNQGGNRRAHNIKVC